MESIDSTMATTTELTLSLESLKTLLVKIETLEKTVKKQQRTINKLSKHVVIPESDAPKKQSEWTPEWWPWRILQERHLILPVIC